MKVILVFSINVRRLYQGIKTDKITVKIVCGDVKDNSVVSMCFSGMGGGLLTSFFAHISFMQGPIYNF